jgi:hypothetical protein
MINHTDEAAQECEIRAVFALDVLDVNRRLLVEHIPVSETMTQCGIGPRKCAILTAWINKHRESTGRPPIDSGVKPATKISEVIGYVC